MFFKFNLDESTEDYIDANFRLGWGNDSVFGNSFIGEINYRKFILDEFAYTWSIDIGFDFYPLLRSPSGIYIGPVVGAMYYHGEKMGINIDTPIINLGGEIGVRILLDWFIIDLGANYLHHFILRDETSFTPFIDIDNVVKVDNEMKFNISIGIMFYAR